MQAFADVKLRECFGEAENDVQELDVDIALDER